MAKVRLTKKGDSSFHVGPPLLQHLYREPYGNVRNPRIKSGEIYEIPDELLEGVDPREALRGSGLTVEVAA